MKKHRLFFVNISRLTLVIRLVKYKIKYAIVEYLFLIIELKHSIIIFFIKTCLYEHNYDDVQINFATHMAESIEQLHLSMSV